MACLKKSVMINPDHTSSLAALQEFTDSQIVVTTAAVTEAKAEEPSVVFTTAYSSQPSLTHTAIPSTLSTISTVNSSDWNQTNQFQSNYYGNNSYQLPYSYPPPSYEATAVSSQYSYPPPPVYGLPVVPPTTNIFSVPPPNINPATSVNPWNIGMLLSQ